MGEFREFQLTLTEPELENIRRVAKSGLIGLATFRSSVKMRSEQNVRLEQMAMNILGILTMIVERCDAHGGTSD